MITLKELFIKHVNSMSDEVFEGVLKQNVCPTRFKLEDIEPCVINCFECWYKALRKEGE